ncbi:hypothetical protein FQN49_003856 [Arthroderma sp. PD_2]|nr:hypothetical protein FQN49_003856 [Arthroderma sp. PD_2]
MNGDSNTQTITSHPSRKRSHREISRSHSDSQTQTAWSQHGEASNSVDSTDPFSNSRPRLPPLPSLPQMRFPGDGFDFRRPIMSTRVSSPSSAFQTPQQEDVIDLTQDSDPSLRTGRTPGGREEARTNRASRGPRFGRNIMSDVVDLEADSPPSSQQQASSPEVQFLGSSSLRPSAPQETARNRNTSNQPQHSQFLLGGTNLMNLLRGIQRPAQRFNQEEILRHELALRSRNFRIFRRVQAQQPAMWEDPPPRDGVDLTIDLDGDVPIQLDCSASGFSGVAPRGAEPVYEPPPAAPEGFTRTAQEDDQVICPNCENELGTGDEIGKQIWVSRPCGHVYCGTCTKNRALSSRAKKADQPLDIKTKPFAKCVVADCRKPVSQPKSMFQVYL